jgi:hypothetical protein
MDRMEDLLGILLPLYYRLILIERGIKRNLNKVCQRFVIQPPLPQLPSCFRTYPFIPREDAGKALRQTVGDCLDLDEEKGGV